MNKPTHYDDMLKNIFDMQFHLNKRIFGDYDKITNPIDTKVAQLTEESPVNLKMKAVWLQNYLRALQQEAAELQDCLPWKFWSRNTNFNIENAKVEAIDMLHFLVSIMQVLGLTADDVYNIYKSKCEVNHARQDANYDHVKDKEMGNDKVTA